MDVSCHRPFLPGTSLEPAVIPTAQDYYYYYYGRELPNGAFYSVSIFVLYKYQVLFLLCLLEHHSMKTCGDGGIDPCILAVATLLSMHIKNGGV